MLLISRELFTTVFVCKRVGRSKRGFDIAFVAARSVSYIRNIKEDKSLCAEGYPSYIEAKSECVYEDINRERKTAERLKVGPKEGVEKAGGRSLLLFNPLGKLNERWPGGR